MWIVIENGNIFEGNLSHFEDCFFCFSTNNPRQEISNWCAEQKWKVQFEEIQ